MKNNLYLLSVLSLALLISVNSAAQTQPTATILNLGTNTITVDGLATGIWANIQPIPIERFYLGETPSLTAYWKSAWNSQGIYVLVEIDDDVWNPYWLSGESDWASDQIELYFDVSDPQKDGGGPAVITQRDSGNWQVAHQIPEISGTIQTDIRGVVHCSTFDGLGQHTREWFVPFTAIPKNGAIINPLIKNVIGFDVSIADNDNDGFSRQRQMWSNDGTVNENWNNCDGVGLVTLSTNVIDNNITYAVTFNVDMNKPITDGEFIEGTDELWMAGSMSGGWNTWNQPGVDPTMKMSESSINNIYTLTLNLNSGQYAYKFFKNASWNYGELIQSDRIVDISAATTINCIWSVKLPEANFSATPRNVNVDESVSFVDATLNTPTNWLWDFGDGSGATIKNPSHAYSKAGNYEVSLTVTNAAGSDTETKNNYITVSSGDSPVADFTVDYTSTEVNTILNFTDLSTNNPTSWLWNFGDGKTSEFKNPSHAYTSIGTYDVSLKATNSSGSNTEVKQNFIVVNAVDISENKMEKWVLLFPNPSKGIFNLKVERNFNNELSYQIIDAVGEVIIKRNKISANGERIDLSNYSRGIYFIQINGANYIQTEKLIVN